MGGDPLDDSISSWEASATKGSVERTLEDAFKALEEDTKRKISLETMGQTVEALELLQEYMQRTLWVPLKRLKIVLKL